MTPLYGHTSPETAYLVADYPYGFKLRCKMRCWLEYKPNKGFRFCTQTTNPKVPYEKWNAIKQSTYCRIAGNMFLDDDNHVHWSGVSEYSEPKEVSDFLEKFPQTDLTELKPWIILKIQYYRALRDGKIPNRYQTSSEEMTKNLEEWTAIESKMEGITNG